MTEPRHEFTVRFAGRGLFYFLFTLAVLMAIWFCVVVFGENQGWSDDPGKWALLPTFIWAIIGVGLFVLLIAYCLALLVVRETSGQTYQFEGDPEPAPEEPVTPSFLQPENTDPAVAAPPKDG